MLHPNRFLIIVGFVLVATALTISYMKWGPPANEANPEMVVTDPEKEAVGADTSTIPLSTEVEPQIVLTDQEKEAVAEFDKRTEEYASLHERLSASLPRLPEKATPEQIDKYQQSMVALIRKERESAKPGEFFTPAMVALVKRASGATVAGSDGKANKETIMDENPGKLPDVTVNDTYPDGTPVSSMPPELLETLPELPENQEYRFLGKRLVLLDTCCLLVLDITPDVIA
ncbi:MAG: hypothetical protein EHM89_01265 [Acidobacteria bacterium]|jgi:hypothetical protein|nr:MAG: hypothetical protein EHM89_01265 [Acidobacteriota bacterium]